MNKKMQPCYVGEETEIQKPSLNEASTALNTACLNCECQMSCVTMRTGQNK